MKKVKLHSDKTEMFLASSNRLRDIKDMTLNLFGWGHFPFEELGFHMVDPDLDLPFARQPWNMFAQLKSVNQLHLILWRR